MITEDYVDFEVAKILKEKGFDECCRAFITPNVDFALESDGRVFNHILLDNGYAAPTLQIVVKWFRETHHIDICVCRELDECGKCFDGYIAVIYKDSCYKVTTRETTEDLKFEEASNKAIEYCLKHLI